MTYFDYNSMNCLFFLDFLKLYYWRQNYSETAFSMTGKINWDTFTTVSAFAFIGLLDMNKENLTKK